MATIETAALELAGAALLDAADREVRHVLASDQTRLTHSLAVGECAEALAPSVGTEDRPLLVAAALLHDIGYSERVSSTGFHPLDGACYLQAQGWPATICDLVAHHSGARFVAWHHGLSTRLAEFAFTENPLTDALTTADQTISPDGSAVRVEERMSEMLARHGLDSPQGRAHPLRAPYLRAAVERVESRLNEATRRNEATPRPRGRHRH